MKTTISLFAQPTLKWAGALTLATSLAACGSSNDPSTPQPTSSTASSSSAPANLGFQATIADFVGYTNWQTVDYAIGNSSPGGLKGAHQGNNDAFTRKTFMNAKAVNSQGTFEEGSIIIKETFTYTMGANDLEKTLAPQGGLLAMVKRGSNFNPEHNGWEWFMLEGDLKSVINQGADLNGGACNACHSQATTLGGMDYSFPKPTEFVATPALFADYTSWDMIEFDEKPAVLGGGAHIDGAKNRRIFQKQVYANPTDADTDTKKWGYPIGTVLVKDISTDAGIAQIVAMVKRGGSFDPANGNWEYFMLEPSDPTKIAKMEGNEVRGAVPMCIGCHVKAEGDTGTDYVFKHQHAPFNTNTTGEYVATKANLAAYTNWMVTDYATGASNIKLGGAHGASNNELARQVFENEKALSQAGTNPYEQGSIIVKEVFTTKDGAKDFAGVFAMVKRGGTYNPDHAGWEWLILDGEGNIQERGDTLKNNGCNACHANGTGSAGVDYTFAKPSTFTATLDDIKDYKTWQQIDEVTGDNLANGGAHSVSGTRKTFKKQASASPYTEAGEYPVGTIIVKEITNTAGSITNLYAMVKRGGDFNPTGGGWEWFTPGINSMNELTTLNSLGAGSFCSGCHSNAGSTTKTDASFLGTDYVFYKKDDPVPMPISSLLNM